MNPRSANQSRFSVRALNSFRTLPAGIWILGFVSMFMDISSEMIHSLLPVYLVSVLGISVTTVGVIEGIAEATAAITKVFSGAISDHLGSRKSLAALGYGLAAGGSACAPWPQPARVEQANGFAHQRRAAVGPIPVH